MVLKSSRKRHAPSICNLRPWVHTQTGLLRRMDRPSFRMNALALLAVSCVHPSHSRQPPPPTGMRAQVRRRARCGSRRGQGGSPVPHGSGHGLRAGSIQPRPPLRARARSEERRARESQALPNGFRPRSPMGITQAPGGLPRKLDPSFLCVLFLPPLQGVFIQASKRTFHTFIDYLIS